MTFSEHLKKEKCYAVNKHVFLKTYRKRTVSRDFQPLFLLKKLDRDPMADEQAKTVSCGHTFFANIFAKTKNFAKPFLPVHMGPM